MPDPFIIYGPTGWHRLVEGEQFVGRSSSCAIKLDDSTVSRIHAKIVVKGDVARVSDAGSHNGTFLNDLPVREETSIPIMGRLRFGQVVFQLARASLPPSACSSGDSTRDWRRDPPPINGLTEAQAVVFRLLLTPASEKEIAQQIGRKKSTIHNHIRKIYEAFKVDTRYGLMSLFIEGGGYFRVDPPEESEEPDDEPDDEFEAADDEPTNRGADHDEPGEGDTAPGT